MTFFHHYTKPLGLLLFFFLISVGLFWYTHYGKHFFFKPQPTIQVKQQGYQGTLFPIQCIDTMKHSRDRAREKITQEKIQAIRQQVEKVASLGANCIAIGTPYNEEFVPVMKLWVSEARRHKLRVWFRGNWAEWEGWFDYPKGMTTITHIARTKNFILTHKELFQDNDIFTPAPEAENGGPFSPVDTPQKAAAFRRFLVLEHTEVQKTFSELGKKVTTNWLSMSGGVAKGVLTDSTIQAMDKTVTLDHYVPSLSEMDEYILYFHDKYHSDLVLGEFGAPIPDINGKMTEKEQAKFVEGLLSRLWYHSEYIKGVNYWTLSESSTALLTHTGEEKLVAHSLRKYYQPAKVTGRVITEEGKAIKNLEVIVKNSHVTTQTNARGEFSLILPAVPTELVLRKKPEYEEITIGVTPHPSDAITVQVILKKHEATPMDRINSSLHELLNRLSSLKKS